MAPVLSLITPQIYIGCATVAASRDMMFEHEITAVLNVASELTPVMTWDDCLAVAHCGLVDGHGNTLHGYRAAILKLADFIERGHTVLVHCQSGISRSPFVVLCYMRAAGLGASAKAINTDCGGDLLDDHGRRLYAFLKLQRPRVDIFYGHLAMYDKLGLDGLLENQRKGTE